MIFCNGGGGEEGRVWGDKLIGTEYFALMYLSTLCTQLPKVQSTCAFMQVRTYDIMYMYVPTSMDLRCFLGTYIFSQNPLQEMHVSDDHPALLHV